MPDEPVVPLDPPSPPESTQSNATAPTASPAPAEPAAPAADPDAPKRGLDDPFLAKVYEDMGVVLEDGHIQTGRHKASEQSKTIRDPMEGRSLGERVQARHKNLEMDAERKKKEGTTDEETTGTTRAASGQAGTTDGKGTTTAASPPPAPTPKPVVVERRPPINDIVDQRIAQALQAAKPELPKTPGPAKSQKETDDEQYEASLIDDQKERLALARYAEKKMPDKYKGLSAKFIEFYRKVDAQAQALKKDNPEFTPKDEEFQRFLEQNQPQFSPSDARRLEREQIKEEAAAEFQKIHSRDMGEIRSRQFKIESQPKIDQAVEYFKKSIHQTIASSADSPASAYAKKMVESGREDLVKSFPMHGKIINDADATFDWLSREAVDIDLGIKAVDPKNQAHVWLKDFIDREGETFSKADKRFTVKDGKQFLPRAQYEELIRSNPGAVRNHWTFTTDDVLGMLAVESQINIESSIKQLDEQLAASGFRRVDEKKDLTKPKNNGQPAVPAPPSPKATGSPSPGAGQQGSTAVRKPFSEEDFRSLGLPLSAYQGT